MDLRERGPGARQAPTVRHPWEVARAALLIDRLRAGVVTRDSRVLDVGAGDGWLAAELQRAVGCTVACWDEHYTAADEAALRTRGLAASRAPPPGHFDVALLFDVLEHADDDQVLLRAALERVRPGARVMVTVPAWPALFSAHDRALHHRRRYAPARCRALLEGAGLRIDEGGGLFHALLMARTLAVLAERAGLPWVSSEAGIGQWRHGSLLTGALVAALRAEQRVSVLAAQHRLAVPGLSYFALCTVLPRS